MKKIKQRKIVVFIDKLRPLFFWITLFYPKSKGTPLSEMLYCFFIQKIFRINGNVPWPVYFTSTIMYSKNIETGNNCSPGLSPGCYVQGRCGITFGNNLMMGPNVGIISSNHDMDDYALWVEEKPIKIGNNVWLGMGAVVLPGVEIGDNVVIAANSVVSKNIPSNVIAAGTPCKVIKEKGSYKGKDYSKI